MALEIDSRDHNTAPMHDQWLQQAEPRYEPVSKDYLEHQRHQCPAIEEKRPPVDLAVYRLDSVEEHREGTVSREGL